MKLIDTILRYPVSTVVNRDGICRIRTFINSSKELFVVITEIDEYNPSASVTNSIENIKMTLLQRGLITDKYIIIEHYEEEYIKASTFDIVSFDNDNRPSWSPKNISKILELLEENVSEFHERTIQIKRLFNEIMKIRNQIDPYLDLPYSENHEVIKRRLEIEENHISKKEIEDLIFNGSKEQDIQKLLKKDLSIFGELYARPNEEYICFSEFPLLNGSIDFVVFSGRSRMDVILIEVKGASFNLVNQRGYKSFSSKIEEAAGQIRKRLGDIHRNYQMFRENVHNIRKKVESGQKLYNSLIGPEGNLEVDENKDISIQAVLIGGRTVKDIEESIKRHDYENTFNPKVRIESWDTWLKKIKRI
ncbi:hypothetical protein QE450_002632 [Paenibacillus sp. SORGH_AS306]|uniref:Shedu immune nuclease family protein n=1 Tax=unclassified Paenibacillus TaxID=185978 RepID=UPI00278B5B8E|nr:MULTISPECIES: Shedu immune nuclease family protein [unclassified Paenibacillus]MDQ1235134.1 hypothetical protein [Paenibacillus sp. SORGH_AS_0306]MDR6112181.1 hypothetical protein [Paenibacillus sp. SORGH_AS_0338]